MAVHYYDEDNIDAGKNINCRVVVNHTIELTKNEYQGKVFEEFFANK
jgi:hypothetical protein